MTSSRPYLVRAIHDWIVDNELTPQLVVNAEVEGVRVPVQFVRDGRIVLNVSARAVRGLSFGNEVVEFDARFSGRPYKVSVPTKAVLAVYASENGVGMAFQGDDEGEDDVPPEPEPPRPRLKVVK